LQGLATDVHLGNWSSQLDQQPPCLANPIPENQQPHPQQTTSQVQFVFDSSSVLLWLRVLVERNHGFVFDSSLASGFNKEKPWP
ncbi:unnamed protein product, partial [Ilex paraguariensis]